MRELASELRVSQCQVVAKRDTERLGEWPKGIEVKVYGNFNESDTFCECCI